VSKRPISPGAEDLLGLYFPVLDHGFVALVDYMGTDECIERAARVSYGHGTRQTSQTRGLIRYLRRHLHTTPSEMVEFKFHCCMPMFVARQWIRHRSACLAGDAKLWFETPSGAERGRPRRLVTSVSKFHQLWHNLAREKRFLGRVGSTGYTWHERSTNGDEAGPIRSRLKRMSLRSVDENTGEIRTTHVNDIWESGSKPVFRVRLANGYELTMSKDHRCLTERGWLTLEQATNLRLGPPSVVSWDIKAPGIAVNGRSGPVLSKRRSHRRTARLVRTYSKIASIEYAGEQMTYDLEVEGPFHNFVANGFVVHNSVNEYSGRYSLMPMLFHLPSREQIQTQSRSNNQGRSGDAVSDATYKEALRRWETIRTESRSTYEWLTGQDVARELARIDLPLSTFTQWYWKIDLHNLLHFLTLRVDRHAQWEIQEYGRVIAGMLKRAAPLSYEAWIDFDVCGARLSRAELTALRRLVARKGDGLEAKDGAALSAGELESLGLSKREARELFEKLADTSVPDFELDLSRALPARAFEERFSKAVPIVDKQPVE
jgi:flavin-dependent thymidylate synthase